MHWYEASTHIKGLEAESMQSTRGQRQSRPRSQVSIIPHTALKTAETSPPLWKGSLGTTPEYSTSVIIR